jgi:hypothetical protein
MTNISSGRVSQVSFSGDNYNYGIQLHNSSVKVDSSSITKASQDGIYITANFDNLSRKDTLEYNTITGNAGNGIRLHDYGNVIANYNNVFGNVGYAFRNDSDKWDEIDARYNWWGENATTLMDAGSNPKNMDVIYDVYDDESKGFVNYSGWLDEKDGTPNATGNTGEVKLVDAAGGEVLTYSKDATIGYVRVSDGDDPQSIMVKIVSTVDSVEITLSRDAAGAFSGSFALALGAEGVPNDEVLQAVAGTELIAEYVDAKDSFGNEVTLTDKSFFGVTLVTGAISTNRTWNKSGSPYLVTGDVTVSNQSVLTVDPGVEVRFMTPSDLSTGDDQSSGQDQNRSELRITDGSGLVAKGSAEEPIIFTSNASSPKAGD